jgi:hypothetical protein
MFGFRRVIKKTIANVVAQAQNVIAPPTRSSKGGSLIHSFIHSFIHICHVDEKGFKTLLSLGGGGPSSIGGW